MESILSEPVRVFVVEDSAQIRERLLALLAEIDGVQVIGEAEGAPDAIARILSTRPDAVVLDISLAPGSGLDVLRAVHPQAPGIAFIVLTNFANPQYRKRCMDAGASHFFDKSTEMAEVKQLLSTIVTARRAHV